MQNDTTKRESRLRRLAKSNGCFIRKSRTRNPHIDDYGNFMVIDAAGNYALLGPRFDATLDDIEAFFK
jgi:hypothetical protein